MIEVQVRDGEHRHRIRFDTPRPEEVREDADDRPVGELDFRLAEADPGVKDQNALGMHDGIGHHDARPSGDRALIGLHEVGDPERLDPDRRPLGTLGHGPILAALGCRSREWNRPAPRPMDRRSLTKESSRRAGVGW